MRQLQQHAFGAAGGIQTGFVNHQPGSHGSPVKRNHSVHSQLIDTLAAEVIRSAVVVLAQYILHCCSVQQEVLCAFLLLNKIPAEIHGVHFRCRPAAVAQGFENIVRVFSAFYSGVHAPQKEYLRSGGIVLHHPEGRRDAVLADHGGGVHVQPRLRIGIPGAAAQHCRRDQRRHGSD